ncbi:AzlD domain-containing protein [Marinitoga lauensis]|uniref:AzlD domain-containing protein n=1 Tax=Marinitoga lauensis TaxID=2201189 RepID=UPI00101085E0|nr:AzlD domain-containing protein [Marinitoga lauensis]
MNKYILTIILMGIVTFIPRVLPFIISDKINSNRFLKRFFKYIPYTILGMLIIPDIFYSTGSFITGTIGFFVALILSFMNLNSIIVIFAAVLIVYILNLN